MTRTWPVLLTLTLSDHGANDRNFINSCEGAAPEERRLATGQSRPADRSFCVQDPNSKVRLDHARWMRLVQHSIGNLDMLKIFQRSISFAVPVAGAFLLAVSTPGSALAGSDYDDEYDGWHTGRHHDWHSFPHHDWHEGWHSGRHSGYHWSPWYGWHWGRHYGGHEGRHHERHNGPHHDRHSGRHDDWN